MKCVITCDHLLQESGLLRTVTNSKLCSREDLGGSDLVDRCERITSFDLARALTSAFLQPGSSKLWSRVMFIDL